MKFKKDAQGRPTKKAERVVRLLDVVSSLLGIYRRGKRPYVDIRDAFMNIPAGKDRRFTVAAVNRRNRKGKFYLVIFNTLVFGSSSSPTLWAGWLGRITAAVSLAAPQLYVDDPIYMPWKDQTWQQQLWTSPSAPVDRRRRISCEAVHSIWRKSFGVGRWNSSSRTPTVTWPGRSLELAGSAPTRGPFPLWQGWCRTMACVVLRRESLYMFGGSEDSPGTSLDPGPPWWQHQTWKGFSTRTLQCQTLSW